MHERCWQPLLTRRYPEFFAWLGGTPVANAAELAAGTADLVV